MARTHIVKKAAKDQGHCRKCGREIKAGDPYKWLQLYHAPKTKICGTCNFTDSQRTGSAKLGAVYDARDAALEVVAGWDPADGDASGLKDAATECAEALREVASEYNESAENIRGSFSESNTADECEERASEIEGYADEVESAGEEAEDFDEDTAREDAGAEFDEDHPAPVAPADVPCKVHDLANCFECTLGPLAPNAIADGVHAVALADWQKQRDEYIDEQVAEKRNEWAEEVRGAVEEALGNCPV